MLKICSISKNKLNSLKLLTINRLEKIIKATIILKIGIVFTENLHGKTK